MFVGIIASAPLLALFDLSRESGLGLALIWTWPAWSSIVVLTIWLLLSLITKLNPPWVVFEAWREERRFIRRVQLEATAKSEKAAEERRLSEAGRAEVNRVAEERRAEAARKAAERGPRNGVSARVPADADDFESVCAEWLQKCGVSAFRTPKGPDGGLDIIGHTYAAQCKFHPSNKVGAPDIQQLAGAAAQAGKSEMGFFHFGPGYTDAAIAAAKTLGIALWAFDTTKLQFRRVNT